MDLKQSTSVVIPFGPFVDKTDGVTLETGLVSAIDHATTGILLSKNGGTLTIRSATVTASTYDAHGCYKVTLSTTDTNTLGTLRVIYTDAATTLPVWQDFEVITAASFNNKYATSGGQLPNAAADAAGGIPISDAGALDLDALNTAAVRLTAARAQAIDDWINNGRLDLILDIIAADVVNLDGAAMRGTDSALTDKDGFTLSTAGILAVWHQALTAIVTAGSVGKLVKDEITTARMATLTDWIDGGRLDALLDLIPTTPMRGTDNAALATSLTTHDGKLDTLTTTVGAAGAGLTALPWNSAWDAEVESEVNDAIDTVISELGVAAPAATPTLRTGMMLMYMALRNKLVVQTSGTDAIEIYNDAGTKIASKLITDSAGDYTEAEMA